MNEKELNNPKQKLISLIKEFYDLRLTASGLLNQNYKLLENSDNFHNELKKLIRLFPEETTISTNNNLNYENNDKEESSNHPNFGYENLKRCDTCGKESKEKEKFIVTKKCFVTMHKNDSEEYSEEIIGVQCRDCYKETHNGSELNGIL